MMADSFVSHHTLSGGLVADQGERRTKPKCCSKVRIAADMVLVRVVFKGWGTNERPTLLLRALGVAAERAAGAVVVALVRRVCSEPHEPSHETNFPTHTSEILVNTDSRLNALKHFWLLSEVVAMHSCGKEAASPER